MSQAQPLSSLAPEYSSKVIPVPQYVIPQNTASVIDSNYIPYTAPCVIKEPECKKEPNCIKEPECKREPECKKPCDPCATSGYGYGWGWLGALILWFIIFTVLFWLIFYSLKPAFVLQQDSNQVDTSKVLLAAVIAALILVIIIWLIKVAVGRR